jgi:hypothetical protein
MHANPSDDPISGEIPLQSLSRSQFDARIRPNRNNARSVDVVAWDWRKETATRLAPDATIPVSLSREGWTFHVLAPVLGSRLAVIGDVSKFVTAGDARLEVSETSTGVRLVVKGPGETVTVTGWAEVAPTSPDGTIEHDSSTGVWTIEVDVPSRGWAALAVDAGSLDLERPTIGPTSLGQG